MKDHQVTNDPVICKDVQLMVTGDHGVCMVSVPLIAVVVFKKNSDIVIILIQLTVEKIVPVTQSLFAYVTCIGVLAGLCGEIGEPVHFHATVEFVSVSVTVTLILVQAHNH